MNIGRKQIGLLCWLCCTLLAFHAAEAGEVRVVDGAGLVRAVKVVRGNARIVVTLQSQSVPGTPKLPQGECAAVNVDGLATERHAQISSKGECVFLDVTEGAWQIRVPQNFAWRVQVYE